MGQILTTTVTVNLPNSIVKELEMTAREQKRTVSEIVQELILQGQYQLPSLPDDVEAELAAFTKLSDEALWLLARSTLSKEEQKELADLNSRAKQKKSLSTAEDKRREELLRLYDRTMVRRAQAALHLQSRGYDISDPKLLQQ